MKVYLINLKRHPEKLERMKERISKYSFLDLEIFTAIDGENFYRTSLANNKAAVNKDWRDPYTQRSITKGEVGCALSHYIIWTKIVKENMKNPNGVEALILEDDVVFEEQFENWENYYQELKENASDYDLVYLSRKKYRIDKEVVSKHLVKPSFSYWANAYLLTFSGAVKLISGNFQKHIIPVDDYLPERYLSYDLIAYAFEPNLIKPENGAFNNSSTEKSTPLLTELPEVFDFIFPYQRKKYHGKFTIITVATDDNDGYERFINSARIYQLPVKTLGMGEEWKGGDMNRYPGGGQKLNLLKKHLNENEYEDNHIILFTDSYDVIFNSTAEEIIQKFLKISAYLVFAGEKNCWPDSNLADSYPNQHKIYKYLNSGGFIGDVKHIKRILADELSDNDDDQLYLTRKFLDNTKNMGMVIDYNCEIFQTLSNEDNEIYIDSSRSRVSNKNTKKFTCILHGNGTDGKLKINNIGNYIPHQWRDSYGYINTTTYLNKDVSYFQVELSDIINGKIDKIKEFIESDKDYLWVYQNDLLLPNLEGLIQKLASHQKSVISPLILNPNTKEPNFKSTISSKSSWDYQDIISNNKKGIWNMPIVYPPYLIKKEVFVKYQIKLGPDFSEQCREKGVFMYVYNLDE